MITKLHPNADTIFVSQNRSVLATDLRGFIDQGASNQGLFVHQTRLLSRFEYRLNEQIPQMVVQSNVQQHSWLGYYIVGSPRYPSENPSQQAIELRVSRFVGDGFHEDLDITNFTQDKVQLTLQILLDADFADQKELNGRQQTGQIQKNWQQRQGNVWELSVDYEAQHEFHNQEEQGRSSLHRGLKVRVRNCPSPPEYQDGQIKFVLELAPHAQWHACLDLLALIDGQDVPLHYSCRSFALTSDSFDARRKKFLEEAANFQTEDFEDRSLASVVIHALEQAKYDLAALRLYDADSKDNAWMMAAGIPMYLATFGRDSLSAAWQAALTSPDLMQGSLHEITRWQGKQVDHWRDEEPNRMIHQVDTGPLAVLNFNPLGRYYGSITASTFYPVVVSEFWHWTGDKQKVAPFIDPALRSLQWLDQYADLDRDGFYEYQTRSQQGLKNQGWKDSADAVVDEEGRQVDAPITICEEQGFAYAAKLQMAEVLWSFGRKEEAKQLYHQAEELKKRFNDAFWMEDKGFFALGLDSQKKQIRSITSNPGHCIATGIVEKSLVAKTAQRLFEDDLFSGWGIRTLSAENPAYNPYSYHRGTIWPTEQSAFALGFYRYGLHDDLERLVKSQFEIASLFDFYRLPECFAGHPRDQEHPFPAIYPQANSPQAWSSSGIFCLLQAMLGLYPYAPFKFLFVDPHLPAWLPEIRLNNLKIGETVVSLLFYRHNNGESGYKILDRKGPLRIFKQPSPWSITAPLGERFKDVMVSLAPH